MKGLAAHVPWCHSYTKQILTLSPTHVVTAVVSLYPPKADLGLGSVVERDANDFQNREFDNWHI